MFAPMILPVQITVLVILVLGVGAVIILPRFGYRAPKVAMIACGISLAAFLPSCIGIGFIVDFVRYGQFSYQSAAEITDGYVRLPASAKDITVFKFASGHHAKFAVSHDDLIAWIDNQHANAMNSVLKKTDPKPDGLPPQLAGHGWSSSADLERHEGPRFARGAGFTVWYSRQQGVAYLQASYW